MCNILKYHFFFHVLTMVGAYNIYQVSDDKPSSKDAPMSQDVRPMSKRFA
jgi:hypothetical protein